MDETPAPTSPSPSGRTYFVEERALLTWWRAGAPRWVALAVGGLLPHLSPPAGARFVALAAGYGVLALFFVVGGGLRIRAGPSPPAPVPNLHRGTTLRTRRGPLPS